MSSMAASQVPRTVELLEMIFLHTRAKATYSMTDVYEEARNLRHLFILQRVNRTFRDTIQGSVQLRRAMFLEEYSAAAEVTDEDGDHEHKLINPLLYSDCFKLTNTYFVEVVWDACKSNKLPIHYHCPDQNTSSKTPKLSIDQEEVSWKSMLLQQDSYKMLWLKFRGWDEYGRCWQPFFEVEPVLAPRTLGELITLLHSKKPQYEIAEVG